MRMIHVPTGVSNPFLATCVGEKTALAQSNKGCERSFVNSFQNHKSAVRVVPPLRIKPHRKEPESVNGRNFGENCKQSTRSTDVAEDRKCQKLKQWTNHILLKRDFADHDHGRLFAESAAYPSVSEAVFLIGSSTAMLTR